MAKTSWMTTVLPLALMLGLAGCNGGDDDNGAPAVEESGQSSQSSQASIEDSEAGRISRDGTPAAEDTAGTAAGSGSTGEQAQADAGGGGDTAQPGEAEQNGDTVTGDAVVGEPADASAANGSWESSGSNVSEALKETERRFKEAEKELNEQFEQAQKQDVKEQLSIEPDETTEGSASSSTN
ncbi:hypothetical protein [Modicisalibacter zincidurans]|uniref:Uncharacterized protein n=1 Tax=Modicisalibacter zincidurans TaxID=1178777 RepID=A0ABP9RLT6_9GAMM|nr:hypothetical protein [Halomonas zincidurans]